MLPSQSRLAAWLARTIVVAFVALCSVFVIALGFDVQFSRPDLHWSISHVYREHVPGRSKNPLRLVIARVPRYEVLYGDPEQETLVGWLDTLECGHQVMLGNFSLGEPSFGPEQGSKRHRCAACAAVQVKKPAQSVALPNLRPAARAASA